MDTMKRDAMLNVRIPVSLKERLAEAAEADHGRSLSGMCVRVFTEWLDEHGYGEAKPRRRTSKAKRG